VRRPRVRPRQPGTREAPGLRPGGTTTALRGARWTWIEASASRPRKRGPGSVMLSLRAAWRHRSGAPRGERPSPRTRASQGALVVRLAALRSPRLVRGGKRETARPGRRKPPGGGALACSTMDRREDAGRRHELPPPPWRGRVAHLSEAKVGGVGEGREIECALRLSPHPVSHRVAMLADPPPPGEGGAEQAARCN